MKTSKKGINLMLIGLCIIAIIGFLLKDFGLSLLLFLLLILIAKIWNHRKYLNYISSDKVAFIQKNQFSYSLLFLSLAFIFLIKYLSENTIYTNIAELTALLIAVLNYIQTRRQILIFHPTHIEDFNKQTSKRMEHITSFNIYENNVEIIFNKIEVLQINKHELSIPDWESFVQQMKTYKEKDYG